MTRSLSGAGRGGQKAAIQAAKLGNRVALVDLNPRIGGICLHDGTIPSKSFREAILHLSGYRVVNHYGQAYRVKHNITMEDLTRWAESIIVSTENTLRDQLQRNRVDILCGWASLVGKHQILVRNGDTHLSLEAEYIFLATGTSPRRPQGFEFDGQVIVDSNGILGIKALPRTLGVVGGGVIGSEYASMFAALGVEVVLIEARPNILGFVDSDIRDILVHSLREHRATIHVNEKVVRCKKSADGRAIIALDSGKRIVTDVLLVSAGRVGNTAALELESLDIECREDGTIPVNESFQTSIPNIYAIGDVNGVSGLASVALEQGRRAACHAFGLEDPFPPSVAPAGIYSIPEIATVGKTEAELTQAKIPYEVGISRYNELERGKIQGRTDGMLKILFHRTTTEVLGVHIVGESATELIHVGEAVLAHGGKLGFLVHMIFNCPSLSQAYKVAALDGFNKLVDTRGLAIDD